MTLVFVGLGLILGVIAGLVVAYMNRPREQESNVGGLLKLVGGLVKL